MEHDGERGAGAIGFGRWTWRATARAPGSPPLGSSPDRPIALKEYLVAAIAAAALALDRLPAAFDLGEFGREAERLLLYALTDAAYPEYTSAAYCDPRGRVLLPTIPSRGDVVRATPPPSAGLRRLLRLTGRGDVDAPLATLELEPLFLAPGGGYEVPALLLAVPSAKLLALRTRRTPTMQPPVLHLELAVYALQYLGEEHALLEPLYERAGDDEPALPPETRRALAALSPACKF